MGFLPTGKGNGKGTLRGTRVRRLIRAGVRARTATGKGTLRGHPSTWAKYRRKGTGKGNGKGTLLEAPEYGTLVRHPSSELKG